MSPLFSIGMNDNLCWKELSFDFLCVSFVNVSQYVCVFLSEFEDGMWDLIVLVPDHCISFYLVYTFQTNYK